MYEVKGFISKGDKKLPLGPGLLANDYEEVFEAMKALGCEYYMFLLSPIELEEEGGIK